MVVDIVEQERVGLGVGLEVGGEGVEKEFDLECIDKARYGQNSLQEKVETNKNFFKEFQEKFKKARLKVIDTNK